MQEKKLEIVMISPEKLKPYFRNPRNNDKTVEALVKIIPRVGFNVPIVVDKDMVIIKGHSRWNASRILGLKEVPVIISEASEEQNNKDRISRIQRYVVDCRLQRWRSFSNNMYTIYVELI